MKPACFHASEALHLTKIITRSVVTTMNTVDITLRVMTTLTKIITRSVMTTMNTVDITLREMIFAPKG